MTPLSRMVVILASRSEARRRLLEAAGVEVICRPVGVDEEAVTASLLAEGASPRDIAGALAELKAVRVPVEGALVLGSDQVLSCEGALFSKPSAPKMAREHLERLSGRTHELWTAAALARNGSVIWRVVTRAKLTMRTLSPAFLDVYLAAMGETITNTVGAYRIEDLGAHLFTRIEGDPFTIQGLPLLEILDALRAQGVLPR
ncbi:MAG: septum formation protein Maf [Alphaproteobacteria bacterium]|nr:septum formation protein Maf [Alphaproteobacteria bacterium]